MSTIGNIEMSLIDVRKAGGYFTLIQLRATFKRKFEGFWKQLLFER